MYMYMYICIYISSAAHVRSCALSAARRSLSHCMVALSDTACCAAFLCVRAGRNKYACKVCHTHTEAQRSSASVFHDSFRRYA